MKFKVIRLVIITLLTGEIFSSPAKHQRKDSSKVVFHANGDFHLSDDFHENHRSHSNGKIKVDLSGNGVHSDRSDIPLAHPQQIYICINPMCPYNQMKSPHSCHCQSCFGCPHCMPEVATYSGKIDRKKKPNNRKAKNPSIDPLNDERGDDNDLITTETPTLQDLLVNDAGVAKNPKKKKNSGGKPSRRQSKRTTSTTSIEPTTEQEMSTTPTSYETTISETTNSYSVDEKSEEENAKKSPKSAISPKPTGRPINIYPISVLLPNRKSLDESAMKKLANYLYMRRSRCSGDSVDYVRMPTGEYKREFCGCPVCRARGELNEMETNPKTHQNIQNPYFK